MTVVVYVDDEPALCRVFERAFRRAGVEAHCFINPEDALAFLATHHVDMVVCDYRMPQMTGLELVERMPNDVPSWVVSGDLDAGEWCKNSPRVRGVIAKPFRTEQVLALVGVT